jgi:hypothetical protein
MAKKTENEGVKIIEGLLSLTKMLLNDHWTDIDELRDDGKIGINVAYRIDYEGKERTLKATISFGKRVSDSREETLDPDQANLDFSKVG